MKHWEVDDMKVGDYISVQVINKKGDRNLDGVILSGVIMELKPDYKMVKLESGWCCHTKDRLLKHTKNEPRFEDILFDQLINITKNHADNLRKAEKEGL